MPGNVLISSEACLMLGRQAALHHLAMSTLGAFSFFKGNLIRRNSERQQRVTKGLSALASSMSHRQKSLSQRHSLAEQKERGSSHLPHSSGNDRVAARIIVLYIN